VRPFSDFIQTVVVNAMRKFLECTGSQFYKVEYYMVGFPYVRLDLYGLIEQKIKGDGNCQVSDLQCFMMALFDISGSGCNIRGDQSFHSYKWRGNREALLSFWCGQS
jgi:hypothetical protein